MDDRRFDSLTRRWIEIGSRRHALRTMAGGAFGLAFAQVGFAAAGGKKKIGARCKDKSECKGDLLCRKANSQQSCGTGKSNRCCIRVDDPCDTSCDCCGIDVICNGGFCQKA